MEKGVEKRLRRVYDRYQSDLRRAARDCGIPSPDIDDIIQETFITFFRFYSLEWQEGRIKMILYMLLRGKCFCYLRTHKTERLDGGIF